MYFLCHVGMKKSKIKNYKYFNKINQIYNTCQKQNTLLIKFCMIFNKKYFGEHDP